MATTRDCTTSPATHSIKDVRRNPETHDWDAYVIVDSEEIYLGSRHSSWDAEALCDTYVYELLLRLPALDAAPDVQSEPPPLPTTRPPARSTALQTCRRFSTPPALTVPRAWADTRTSLCHSG
jgi:hypothetical protein